MKAIIQFSNGSALEIHETDVIIPITPLANEDVPSSSMGATVNVTPHVHNGLLPSLMNAFCNCDFFYLNHDYSIAYCSKSIVSVKTEL